MASEPLESREVTPQQWEGRWVGGVEPRFHRKMYSPNLQRFYHKAYGNGGKKRIFVPLCGKTLDLIFFADNGNEVVGLEFSKIAVESFFNENSLTYTTSVVENSSLVKYQAKEKDIILVQGDLFNFGPSICGVFDGVWDRGSFVAINIPTRKTYAELMSSLLEPGGRILMEAPDYDQTKFPGPPHVVREDNLRYFFGENFDIEYLYDDKDDVPKHFKVLDMGFMRRVFLLSRK